MLWNKDANTCKPIKVSSVQWNPCPAGCYKANPRQFGKKWQGQANTPDLHLYYMKHLAPRSLASNLKQSLKTKEYYIFCLFVSLQTLEHQTLCMYLNPNPNPSVWNRGSNCFSWSLTILFLFLLQKWFTWQNMLKNKSYLNSQFWLFLNVFVTY